MLVTAAEKNALIAALKRGCCGTEDRVGVTRSCGIDRVVGAGGYRSGQRHAENTGGGPYELQRRRLQKKLPRGINRGSPGIESVVWKHR